jgi:hypothetical protein
MELFPWDVDTSTDERLLLPQINIFGTNNLLAQKIV